MNKIRLAPVQSCMREGPGLACTLVSAESRQHNPKAGGL